MLAENRFGSRPEKFVGILLVFLGLFFLVRNFEFIPENFDFGLWRLWPLLFIYVGLASLRVPKWLGLLCGILAAVVTGALLGFFFLGTPMPPEAPQEIPLEAAPLEVEGL